jgi:uncharacterized protein (DUF433 family)
LQTDGVDILIAHLGDLVAVSAGGQIAARPLIQRHLARLDWDESRVAIRLYPFTRPDTENQERAVVIDPRVSFGRPLLVGTGAPTRELHERFVAGDSMAAIAADFGCPPDLVEEGIRFEQKAA